MKRDTNGQKGRTGLETIRLPKPAFGKDKTVFYALTHRETIREVSSKKLPLQTVANLLWAACGVNRKKGPFGTPGITAASASNSQEILVYALMEDGAYLYDAAQHTLVPVTEWDLRPMAIGRGQRTWGSKAPVRLVYVADIDRFSRSCFDEPKLHEAEGQKSYYYSDTGLIAGNVYLFAAAQGLAAWFHNCDKEGLHDRLKLRKDQTAIFGHTIGFPKKMEKKHR
jgi:hypothetical protein